MSKVLSILSQKAKENGVEAAEVAIVKAYNILEETCQAAVVDPETSQVEKSVCGALSLGLSAFKEAVAKLADLNKDGKVG
ncbi:hypothetical protein phi1422_0070 [Bdellovibrio phage phi1422]|uniref:hypothetical protein n=1 Tax=Bdellovibrio phage phi1422 TaxID=1127515 RepID=UPI0002536D95|nr:hypothetical protein F395_gp70 [Bdellovibrio phage phi1422]AFC22590.1 hypothetical protein phi1422_0070 [Bdellovibrio phage phi1422]